MKKVMFGALALLAFAGSASAANNQASATNQMQVAVPQILSVTAEPNYQAVYMTEADLGGSKALTDVVFTIKSNATYNVKTDYSTTIAFTNHPGQTEKDASLAAFRSAMKFARSTDNLWYDLGTLESLSPFNENNNAHTAAAGSMYTYHARIDNLSFNAAPGVYTVNLVVTATQP